MALTSRKATSKKVDESIESAPRRFGSWVNPFRRNKPDVKLVILIILIILIIISLTSRKATSKKVDESSESAPRRFGSWSSGIVIPSNRPEMSLPRKERGSMVTDSNVRPMRRSPRERAL